MLPTNKAINICLTKYSIFIVLILFFLSACSLVLDRDAVSVKVSSLPAGQPSLKKGKIITFAGVPKKAAKTTKVKFNNLNSEQPSKSTEIVVATFDNQIKLIDFVGPEINEQPDLSFKSTARSLVFMNPLFLGLSFEAKKIIFTEIEKDPDFSKLVDAVANSLSLFDDNIIDLSTKIALRVAENQKLIIVNDNNNSESSGSPLALSPSTSPNNVDSNPFAQESFPKKSCGDNFPKDPKDFPVSFYPVFVDYSETNLKKINLNFCEDAYQLIRKETGKESIQVGSFTSIDRAEAFKKFMTDKVGSAEVGKPKIYENPHKQSFNNSFFKVFSNLSFKPVIEALIPVANAQIESKWLEYSMVSQFTNDGLFPGTNWPLWHGLELKVDSSGIKIVGTPLIAQQVIVLPQNATNRSTDAVVDEIIYPANLGTWDGNTIKTLSGGNQVEIDLIPKPGKTWQPGNYDVLISGGSALKRSDSQKGLEAFQINILFFLTDVLAFITGDENESMTPQKINDRSINLSPIAADCLPELNKEISKEKPQGLSAFAQLTQCLAKADNLIIIAQIFGISNEQIFTELFSQLIKFEGEAWEKTLENAGKKAANVLNVFEKSVAVSKIFVFGKYLEHENTKNELYYASFSVNEITEEYPSRTKTTPFASRTIDLDCSPGNPGKRKYQELDVIIEVSCYSSSKGGISLIKATNYSQNAVEVSFPIPGSRSDLLLPDQSQTYRASIPWHLRDNWKNRPEGIQTSALDYFDFIERFLPYKLPLSLNSYSSRQLIKEVRVKCSDSSTTLWGVEIEPQCVPPGLRATFKNMTDKPIQVGLVGLNKPPIYLKPEERWSTGGQGSVQSSGTQVTLSIIINY